MSLKLGNTNIAGTQVLYSTTGNNTDGAMTQAITTTQLNLKANDADVVHKKGNEAISGKKTFNKEIYSTTSNVINRITALGDGSVRIFDYNSSIYTRLRSINNSASVPKETCIDVIARQDGITQIDLNADKVFSTASDADGTVVTTVSKSKTTNGYFKFGNGLIIQWGNAGSGGTITFPTPFSSDNFSVTATIKSANGTNNNDAITAKRTTGFDFHNYSGGGCLWVAIGY